MADLIKFPAARARSVAAYQLYRFNPNGSVRSTVQIRARNDAGARRQAHRLSEGLRFELWSDGRFLDHVSAADHPVATSIRLLDDPSASEP